MTFVTTFQQSKDLSCMYFKGEPNVDSSSGQKTRHPGNFLDSKVNFTEANFTMKFTAFLPLVLVAAAGARVVSQGWYVPHRRPIKAMC